MSANPNNRVENRPGSASPASQGNRNAPPPQRKKLPLIKKKELVQHICQINPDLTPKKIEELRFKYCDFMQVLGEKLGLPQLTIATGKVFCHRFFLRHAFNSSKDDNNSLVIGSACLFLAGKVEETPKPLNEVVKASFELRQMKNSSRGIQDRETYEKEKERILVAERRVLHAVEFEFSVEHPYILLLTCIKRVVGNNKKLAQAAWNMLNDSLRTLLSLQYEALKLALASVHVTAKFLEIALPTNGGAYWWTKHTASYKMEVTLEEIEDISNQMLDMYQVEDPKAQTSSRGANEGAETAKRPPADSTNAPSSSKPDRPSHPPVSAPASAGASQASAHSNQAMHQVSNHAPSSQPPTSSVHVERPPHPQNNQLNGGNGEASNINHGSNVPSQSQSHFHGDKIVDGNPTHLKRPRSPVENEPEAGWASKVQRTTNA